MNETEPADGYALPVSSPPSQPLQGIMLALLLLGVISVGVGFVIGGSPGPAQATSVGTQAATSASPVLAPPVTRSPPTTSPFELIDWVVEYLPPFEAVQADLSDVADALGTYSPAAITRACARMASHLDDLAAVPDAPDSALARHNANLVENFQQSAEACMVGDYAESGLYMQLGTDDMERATARMNVLTP